MKSVSDIHVSSNLALPAPAEFIQSLAPGDRDTGFIARSRSEIRDIVFGKG